MVRRRAGGWFDPGVAEAFARFGANILSEIGSGTSGRRCWRPSRRRRAPSVGRAWTAWRGPCRHGRPQVAVPAGPLQRGGRLVGASRSGARPRPRGRHRPAASGAAARPGPGGGLQPDLGEADHPQHHRVGTRPPPPLPDRADPGPLPDPGAAGPDSRDAPRATRRVRLPPGNLRRPGAGRRPGPGRRRRLPGHDPGPPPPPGDGARGRHRGAGRAGTGGPPGPRGCPGGHRGGRAAPTQGPGVWPAGLSDREIDVLRLVARGLSNRAIAGRLVISPRTAEHHVQHIYTKIGASTRAAAAMFAMEHGLLRD